jgi:lipoprotein-releasing system ATP-binding protein
MLIAKKLEKSFEGLRVLKGIDLEIQKGELIAIVGASGAGKSTLLHILGTLERPDSGSLQIGGSEVSTLGSDALAEFRNKNIGFVFQFHNLLPEFSALENIMIPGFIAKKNEKEIHRKANELLSILGISERRDHKPSQLSGGEQQRVAVARALINSPALVFADEPSGNLDSRNATELHNLFFQLKKELNQTFVIVTHNTQFADLADRKLEIKDGIIFNG